LEFHSDGMHHVYCRSHPKELRLLICFSCETQPFCVECLIEGAHQTHSVRNIEKSLEILREKSEDLAIEVKSHYDDRLHQLSKLEEKFSAHEGLHDQTQKHLESRFQELYQMISDKKKEVLDEYIKQRNSFRDASIRELHELEKTRATHNEYRREIETASESPDLDYNYLVGLHRSIEKGKKIMLSGDKINSFIKTDRPKEEILSGFTINETLILNEIRTIRPISFNVNNPKKPSKEKEEFFARSPHKTFKSILHKDKNNYGSYIEGIKNSLKKDQSRLYYDLKQKIELLGSKNIERFLSITTSPKRTQTEHSNKPFGKPLKGNDNNYSLNSKLLYKEIQSLSTTQRAFKLSNF
jgi:hypothetical protein